MKILFFLSHPAHFHLCKNTIMELREKGHKVRVAYNDKDVLEGLILDSGFEDLSRKIRTVKGVTRDWQLKLQFIQKNLGMLRILLAFRPRLVVGTSVIISLLGKVLGYKSIIVNEDDFDIIQKTANLGYPYADHILCPWVCRTGRFDKQCLKYHSYHELAYLHPDHFKADPEVVRGYFPPEDPYFIIRFVKLSAHHDVGVKGIDEETAKALVEVLRPHGKVYITSERPLGPELEPYRISIKPKDMHHVMAFAQLYIGDSQTMAAEAGVMGTPYIRFNSFVGRISYLDELEREYRLGEGIHADDAERLLPTVERMITDTGLKQKLAERRALMLSEKVDLAEHLTWFLENYPESVRQWDERVPEGKRSRILNGLRAEG